MTSTGSRTTVALGTRAAASAEAEERGWRAQALREEWEGSDADSAAHEKRPLDVEVEAAAERARDMDLVPDLE